jgi:hypothetical protein
MVENANGVLCHKESWFDVRNNSEGFPPHPSLIVNAFLFSSMAHRLTRNASTNNINLPFIRPPRRKRPHVAPPLNVRPVLRQHPAGPIVYLYLPLADHTGTLEAQVEAADTSEQRPECERLRTKRCNGRPCYVMCHG